MLFNYICRPQNPKPRSSPLRPRKLKNDPKIKSKSKVRIEGIIENKSCSRAQVDPTQLKVKNHANIKSYYDENKSCSTTLVDPKSGFEPYPDSKNSL